MTTDLLVAFDALADQLRAEIAAAKALLAELEDRTGDDE